MSRETNGTAAMHEVNRAIETVQASRQTHVQWRDYWLSVGESHSDCTCGVDHSAQVATAGGLDHHVAYIARYDQVLDVLRRLRP